MSRMSRLIVAAIAAGGAPALAISTPGMILNEFNAVSEANFLEFDNPEQGDGFDLTFGRVQGNGGNWVEFVVTTDRLDIRGWTLDWANADPDQGSFTFNQSALWSDLRAGTIITVREDDLGPPGVGMLVTDTSFNPSRDDWHIHINLDDINYLTQSGFKVDNDNWQATLKDASGAARHGPIGEGLNDINGWGGTGLNSREAGALQTDPTTQVSDGRLFNDADYSSFGKPNQWFDLDLNQTFVQDFSEARTWWTARAAGDANLDGFVDVTDLGILATNWQGSDRDWFTGDFDGDGLVNVSDLGILATNWLGGATGPASDASLHQALIAAGLGGVIPEPASLSLLAVAGLALRRRR